MGKSIIFYIMSFTSSIFIGRQSAEVSPDLSLDTFSEKGKKGLKKSVGLIIIKS